MYILSNKTGTGTGTGGVTCKMCPPVLWILHTQPRKCSLTCSYNTLVGCADLGKPHLCFHPSESDSYRSLCSELRSLVAPLQAMQSCQGGKHSGGISCCVGVSGVLGLPDGFLIDFSGPLPFFSLHPLLLLFFGVRGVQRRTYLLDRLQPNPLHMSTCYLWAWGLIYGSKSTGVQFLTAQTDNGGDWMKQFVTSSLPLTFTGCWLISPKGALLGIDVHRWSYWYGFFLLILNVNSQ